MTSDTNADQDLIPPEAFVEAQGIGKGQFREIGDSLFARYCALDLVGKDDVVLDIGCGLGRIARPMTRFLSSDARYYGFDINRGSIAWCREHYARFLNFHFDWIDLQSVYYNKGASTASRDFRFPLRDSSVDFINLTSVFTHMFIEDVEGYLMEIGRMLRPGKRCFITYFLIDWSIRNWCAEHYHKVRGDYVRDPNCPETMILLDECTVIDLYPKAGLHIESKNYGKWADQATPARAQFTGYQDEIIAVRV